MSTKSFRNYSRGELVRMAYGEDKGIDTIRESIGILMGEVDGAECATPWMEHNRFDEHSLAYLISPEGVVVNFHTGINVSVTTTGDDREKRSQIERKFDEAIGKLKAARESA